MRVATSATVDHLVERWRTKERAVLRQVFPLLAQGCPVDVTEIAERSAVGVEFAARALADGRASLDDQGRVVELFGVQLQPTAIRLQVGGATLFSCCALVAHLAPRLFGTSTRVAALDPVSLEPVALTVDPDGVESRAPSETLASFAATDRAAVLEDVGAAVCSQLRHFASEESALEFAAGNDRRYVVELDEIDQAAERLHQQLWR